MQQFSGFIGQGQDELRELILSRSGFVGTPAAAVDTLRHRAEVYDVDELMVLAWSYDFERNRRMFGAIAAEARLRSRVDREQASLSA